MRQIKIKAAMTRDFYTDSVNIFIEDDNGPQIDIFWNWDGDNLMSNVQLRDEFNKLKLKKGDYIPVEITIKQRPKRGKK